MSLPLCNRCKRRYAVYRRPSSGEKLCIPCLFWSLVGQVRKALHYYSMIHSKDKVLFALRWDKPAESIEALRIFRKAASSFEPRISILCVDRLLNCDAVLKVIERIDPTLGTSLMRIRITNPSHVPRSFTESVKLLEYTAARVASKEKFNSVVIPVFRDEMFLFSFAGFVHVDKTLIGDSLPVKVGEEYRIVKPFFYVLGVDVAVLTYNDSFLRDSGREFGGGCIFSEAELGLIRRLQVLTASSLEVVYSSAKTVEILQSFIVGSRNRCSVCLSFSDEELCRFCKAFELQGIDIRFS